MIKIILLVLLLGQFMFGANYSLTKDQIKKIQDVYNIGKTIKAKDGTTFEKTLPSIMGQESSWGEEVIGDKYDVNGKLKSVYESSLGNFQIKLSTAKLTIRMYPNLMKKYGHMLYDGESIYLEYEKNKAKMEYYKGVLDSKIWRKRYDAGETKAIKTLTWATKNFEKHRLIHNSLVEKAKKDTKLINKLLTSHKFGAEIAGHYLKYLYNTAVNKRWSKAYKRSIGRYNGGWNNMTYANKVIKRMGLVKKLIRNRAIY